MVIRDRALSCLTLFSVCASEAEGLLKLPDPPEVMMLSMPKFKYPAHVFRNAHQAYICLFQNRVFPTF